MCRGQDILQQSVLFFHHVGPGASNSGPLACWQVPLPTELSLAQHMSLVLSEVLASVFKAVRTGVIFPFFAWELLLPSSISLMPLVLDPLKLEQGDLGTGGACL